MAALTRAAGVWDVFMASADGTSPRSNLPSPSAVVAEHLAEGDVEAGADREIPDWPRAVGAVVDVADRVVRGRLARDRLLPHAGEAALRRRHDALLGAVDKVDRHDLDARRRGLDAELA